MIKNKYIEKIGKKAKLASLNLLKINVNKRNSVLKEFSKNLKLLNVMSNISYKKIYRGQKGLGVFMDILFRSCEQ